MRPQAAGAAAGLTGFTQMTIGAIATQLVTLALAGATTGMPLAWMALIETMVMALVFWGLARR